MCSPSGRERYTTGERKPPGGKLPQRAASEYRREVVGREFGRGAGRGIRMVGDVGSWQLYASLTDAARADLRCCWVSCG